MKKLTFCTGILLLSSVIAEEDIWYPTLSVEEESLPQDEESFFNSRKPNTPNQASSAKNSDPSSLYVESSPMNSPCSLAATSPCTVSNWNFFITGDFIYWTARQDNMEFATFVDRTTQGFTGSFAFPTWEFEPGFKVGIGGGQNNWDVYAYYTRLSTHTLKDIQSGNGLLITDRFNIFNSLVAEANIFISHENARWTHQFNVVDLELGYTFCIGSNLQLRPYFGAKGTWQNQKLDIAGEAILSEATPVGLLGSGNFKNTFWGLGFRSGVNTSWYLMKYFSIKGNVSAAILSEKFSLQSDIESDFLDVPAPSFRQSFQESFYSIKPVLEFFGGICLETPPIRCFTAALEVGWEMQWWGGQNQFYFFSSQEHGGDLWLQGLTAQLRVDF